MPIETVQLPSGGMDDREPLNLEEGKGPLVSNHRMHRERFQKRPGVRRMDVSNVLGRTMKQIFFDKPNMAGIPIDNTTLVLFEANLFYVFDPPTAEWVLYRDFDIPAGLDDLVIDADTTADERYSVVNILNSVVWSSTHTKIKIWQGQGPLSPVNLDHGLLIDQNDPESFPITLCAMVLLGFNNRIIAIRTREDGVDQQNRVRWSANGNVNDWVPDLDTGAGLLQVQETSMRPLTGGFVLNDRAYVTTEREILELVVTGQVANPFRVDSRVQGIGMIAPHSWAAADYFGFLLGPDNVYSWDGANLKPVGERVQESIFSNLRLGSIVDGNPQRIQGEVFHRRHEYWLFTTTGPSLSGPDVWIYDYRADKWYIDNHQALTDIKGFCMVDPSEFFAEGSAGFPMRTETPIIVGGAVDEKVYVREEQLVDLIDLLTAEAIETEIITKDYQAKAWSQGGPTVSPEHMNSLREITFKADPNRRFVVFASSDQGEHWQELYGVSNDEGVVRVFPDIPFHTIRFRIKSAEDHQPNIRGSLAFQWKPAGRVL